jgi:hypothetical protein
MQVINRIDNMNEAEVISDLISRFINHFRKFYSHLIPTDFQCQQPETKITAKSYVDITQPYSYPKAL